MEGEFIFDFEKDLVTPDVSTFVPEMPVGEIGQQPRNFVRNFRKVRSSLYFSHFIYHLAFLNRFMDAGIQAQTLEGDVIMR